MVFYRKAKILSQKNQPPKSELPRLGVQLPQMYICRMKRTGQGYLGMLVQDALPDNTITVINAGVPGYDTAQSIGNLALRVMSLKPDIVIIYHAYNDLKAIRSDIKFNPDYSHIHNKPFGFHQRPNFIIQLFFFDYIFIQLF